METAERISDILSRVSYPGRGIIVGTCAGGKNAVFAYFLTGRSLNSRNRILVADRGEVFTRPFDEKAVEDPSLIIYKAAGKVGKKVIVTNGDQTDTVLSALKYGGDFKSALKTRSFEPDFPNFTPRISAELDFNGEFGYSLSILKSADEKGSSCERFFFDYPSQAGVGHYISTYLGDGNPLPSFSGEPKRVLISDDIDAFTKEIWNSLNAENKIALYCRFIDIKSGEYREIIENKLS